MELITRNDLSAEKWIVRLGHGLLWLTILLTFLLWFHLIFKQPSTQKLEHPLPKITLSALGEESLALSRPLSKELQPLLHDLMLIGVNTRPDQELLCSLALRSSAQEKTISLGETLYFETKDGRFLFSDTPTELTFTARALENNLLLCDLKHNEASETCALNGSVIFSHALDQEPYIEALKQGAVWGKDVFLTGWGGEEYREMTNKAKISVGPDVHFLKPGDCLFWNGTQWVSEWASQDLGPIAQLMKATLHGADFQVWDPTGFSTETIHLEAQPSLKTSLKVGEIMTAIRPRSPSEITCQLGKRRVIVREGDWWIRTDNRWKPVRTAADLEACLNHQIPGELFIFEKVEASKGKVTLKGQAFDRMRTFSEPVSLVLQTEKKQSHSHKSPTGSPQIAKKNSHAPVISHSPRKNEAL